MICTDREYHSRRKDLRRDEQELEELTRKLRGSAFSPEVGRKIIARRSETLKRSALELEHYERLKAGDLNAIPQNAGFGRMLVALRIGLGISRTDLAAALSISEHQLARDEDNEYRSLSPKLAERLLNVLTMIERRATGVSRVSRSPNSLNTSSPIDRQWDTGTSETCKSCRPSRYPFQLLKSKKAIPGSPSWQLPSNRSDSHAHPVPFDNAEPSTL